MAAFRDLGCTTVEDPGMFSHIELNYALEISLRNDPNSLSFTLLPFNSIRVEF